MLIRPPSSPSKNKKKKNKLQHYAAGGVGILTFFILLWLLRTNKKPDPLLIQLEQENLLLVEDATSALSDCLEKNKQNYPEFSGTHPALICTLHEQLNQSAFPTKARYFLKEIGLANTAPDGCVAQNHNYPLGAAYNRQLAITHLNITIPTLRFFKVRKSNPTNRANEYNGFSYYLASKEMIGFKVADGLSFEKWQYLITKHNNLAKFAVAQSFIGDLHGGNYGFLNEQLVLIDIDSIHPEQRDRHPTLSLSEHIQRHCHQTKFNMELHLPLLSRNDLITMITIYEEMAATATTTPKLHPCFDMPDEVYYSMLGIYIQACKSALESYGSAMPDFNRHKKTAKKEKEQGLLSTHAWTLNDELNLAITLTGEKIIQLLNQESHRMRVPR